MDENGRGRGRRRPRGGRGQRRRGGGQGPDRGQHERNDRGQNGNYRNGNYGRNRDQIPNIEPSEEARPIGVNNLTDKYDDLDGQDLAKFCISHRGFGVLTKVKFSPHNIFNSCTVPTFNKLFPSRQPEI